MNKYEPLWRFLQADGSGQLQLSFLQISDIVGFEFDHSFLNYKKEAAAFGYTVAKISLKERRVSFVKTDAATTPRQ